MRSPFKVLFYVNGSKEKNGIVPIMGRVTINGSVAQFSCKLTIAKTMWDAKGNRAKGKSKEAREINLALDNINDQIIKHYQRISDREAYNMIILMIPNLVHKKLKNRHCRLFRETILPDGLTTAFTLPTTSEYRHSSLATIEPSP